MKFGSYLRYIGSMMVYPYADRFDSDVTLCGSFLVLYVQRFVLPFASAFFHASIFSQGASLHDAT